MLLIPPELRYKKIAILVNAPENAGHSNGIAVLLDAVKIARSLGIDICIVPSHSNYPLYTRLPYPYEDLPLCWDVPLESFALLCDTIIPERLNETRAKASQICHYALAPSGLFRGTGNVNNRVVIKTGERQAVYSSQVSTSLPSFYLQSRFVELEPWIELCLKKSDPKISSKKHQNLRASVYAGKGYLRSIDPRLRQCISFSGSHLITRSHPRKKSCLYRCVANTDLLVSFDPLSSLAYEATLLGIPVFVDASWDESQFIQSFPVRLDGIVWGDTTAFLNLLKQGFDHQAVVDSYRAAISRNPQTLIDLLSFAFGVQSVSSLSADQLNSYWDTRQPFFARMNLPSPPSSWGPISIALPPSTSWEHIQNLGIVLIAFCRTLGRKFITLCRVILHSIHSVIYP